MAISVKGGNGPGYLSIDDIDKLREALNSHTQLLSCTVKTDGWSESNGFWIKEVALQGMKAEYNPIVSIAVTTADKINDEFEAFSQIVKCTTKDGSVVFYAIEAPETEIVVQFKGV